MSSDRIPDRQPTRHPGPDGRRPPRIPLPASSYDPDDTKTPGPRLLAAASDAAAAAKEYNDQPGPLSRADVIDDVARVLSACAGLLDMVHATPAETSRARDLLESSRRAARDHARTPAGDGDPVLPETPADLTDEQVHSLVLERSSEPAFQLAVLGILRDLVARTHPDAPLLPPAVPPDVHSTPSLRARSLALCAAETIRLRRTDAVLDDALQAASSFAQPEWQERVLIHARDKENTR